MGKYKVQVDINEACRYMGCRGDIDGSIKNELQDAAALIEAHVIQRVNLKIWELDKSNGLALTGTCLKFEGTSIAALLHDCDSCAIFCATIGNDIDALIRKWQIKDLAYASMLDACGSSAVESLCDSLQKELEDEYAAQGLFLTDRFSPGYGDLPISIQHDFCAVLDTTRKIGVSVSKSGIMIPQKSVTAIIGFSKNLQKHFETGCRDCSLTANCKFRENGVTCYGQAI